MKEIENKIKEIENKIKEIENRIKGVKESTRIHVFMIIMEYIIAFAAPAMIASPAISIVTMFTFMAIPNIHYDSIYKNIIERENYEKNNRRL